MQASSDTEAIVDVRFDICSVGCLNLTVLVAGLWALASDEGPNTLGTSTSYSGKGKGEGGSLEHILCVRAAWLRHYAHTVTKDVVQIEIESLFNLESSHYSSFKIDLIFLLN